MVIRVIPWCMFVFGTCIVANAAEEGGYAPSKGQAATDLTQKIRAHVEKFHEADDSTPPGGAEATEATEALSRAVDAIKKDLQADLDRREVRIAETRDRLDKLAQKISDNRRQIDQIARARFDQTLSEIKALASKKIATPEALVKRLVHWTRLSNADEFVACFDDNGIRDVAAVMLTTAASMQMTQELMTALGAEVPADPSFTQAFRILKILEGCTRQNPTQEAINAYARQVSAFSNMNVVVEDGESFIPITVGDMRASTGVLKDPRQFARDVLNSGAIPGSTFVDAKLLESKTRIAKAEEGGDVTMLIGVDPEEGGIQGKLRFRRSDGSWRVHEILDDAYKMPASIEQGVGLGSKDNNAAYVLSQLLNAVQQEGGSAAAASNPGSMIQYTPANSANQNTFVPSGVMPPVYPVPRNNQTSDVPPPRERVAVPSPMTSGMPDKPFVFKGRDIDSWLLACAEDVDSDEAFDAVNRLRTQPSTHPTIRRAMEWWFSSVKNELSEETLGRFARGIVRIGGEEMRSEAMDYVMKFVALGASRKTFGDLLDQKPYFLSEAIVEISMPIEEYVAMITEKLHSGSAPEREFAMVCLVAPPEKFARHEYSRSQKDAIGKGLLAASEDEHPSIQWMAVRIYGYFVSLEEQDAAPLLARTAKVLESSLPESKKISLVSEMRSIVGDHPAVRAKLKQWSQSRDPQLVTGAIDAVSGIDGADTLIGWLSDIEWARGMSTESSRYPPDWPKSMRYHALYTLGGMHVSALDAATGKPGGPTLPPAALAIYEKELQRLGTSKGPESKEHETTRELCKNMIGKLKVGSVPGTTSESIGKQGPTSPPEPPERKSGRR